MDTTLTGKALVEASVDASEVNADDNVVAATIERTEACGANESIRMVDYSKIKVDLVRNPRFMSSYSIESLAWLARSIYKFGLNEALVLSKRDNGELWLLQGVLRYTSIGFLQTVGVKGTKADAAIEANPEFMAKVKCRVFTGLTQLQELDLVMDHGQRTELSRAEIYMAARTMDRMGLSQSFIAAKFGKHRSVYQKIANVMKMPLAVEDILLTDPKSEGHIDLPDAAITELYKQLNLDKANADAAGTPLRPRTGGPLFDAALAKFLKDGTGPRVKSMTTSYLMERREKENDADVQDLLLAIATNDKTGLGNALTRLEVRIGANAGDRVGVRVISEGITTTVGEPDDNDES